MKEGDRIKRRESLVTGPGDQNFGSTEEEDEGVYVNNRCLFREQDESHQQTL
jgi:hypothetical protein